MPPPPVPGVEIHLSPSVPGLLPPGLDLDWLSRVAMATLPLCLQSPGVDENVLAGLQDIEVTLVSDAEIAAVHGEFLDDPTPTDVITFHHGEILISLETATRQAAQHGLSVAHETALYLVHGLLHLAGWDDHDPDSAAAMASLQERLLMTALSAG